MSFKKINFLLLALFLSGCSAQTELHLPIAALPEGQQANMVRGADTAVVVEGNYCELRSAIPFYWKLDTDGALKDALGKAPGAIALQDVTVTQKVQFFLIRSKICVAVVGMPLYVAKQ